MTPTPTPSQRRHYHEAAARFYRIEENRACLTADSNEALVIKLRCDWSIAPESRIALEERCRGIAKSALERAVAYKHLADIAETEATLAKNEEIQRDYYSGPPGSFTGD